MFVVVIVPTIILLPIELNEFMINKSVKDNKIYETTESISSRINEFIDNLKNLNLENILVVSHGDTIKWITKVLINNVGYDNFQGSLNNSSYCAIKMLCLLKTWYNLFVVMKFCFTKSIVSLLLTTDMHDSCFVLFY